MGATKLSEYNSVMIILVLVNFLSKVCGFTRDIFLSTTYGASYIVDVFLITLSLPDIVLDILTNTIILGFIPTAVMYLRQSIIEYNYFTNVALRTFFTIGGVFTLTLLVLSNTVVNIAAPGFNGDVEHMASIFLKITSFVILLKCMNSILSSYLSGLRIFLPTSFLGIIFDLLIIIGIYYSNLLKIIELLPLSVLVGVLFQFLFLLYIVQKRGFRFIRNAKFFNKDSKIILSFAFPAILSVGVMQISTLYNRALASGVMEGGVTLLNNASKMAYVSENIIVGSVIAVSYPLLSDAYGIKDLTSFNEIVQESINKLIVYLLPISGILAVLSYPLIQLFFGHGAYTNEHVIITSKLMVFHVLGILGVALQAFLARCLFAMGNIKVTLIASSILLVAYLSLTTLLSEFSGIYGIALATGISYNIGGIIYYIIINKICNIDIHNNIKHFIKAFVIMSVLVILNYIISNFFETHILILIIVSLLISVLMFLVLCFLLKIECVDYCKLKNLIVRS